MPKCCTAEFAILVIMSCLCAMLLPCQEVIVFLFFVVVVGALKMARKGGDIGRSSLQCSAFRIWRITRRAGRHLHEAYKGLALRFWGNFVHKHSTAPHKRQRDSFENLTVYMNENILNCRYLSGDISPNTCYTPGKISVLNCQLGKSA